ncbi:hypothetical protein [Taibaiella chishuiensis]|uniref:Uncharacterized protein n=1 Tax=Taibaiella chishuiensis TaxID=1434707 RepID=A0A2P8D460_9BACT|nr:hypothetical protein [Taibaiella chishuiensis]PSK91959.1 hypothetical protein B0I18_10453 [Taibaiella chishuiensis]
MKRTLFILLSLHALAGCAQNKDQQAKHNTTMAQTETAKPVLDFNRLKQYDQEPIYQMEVNSESFGYQVLVNDVTIYTHSGRYGGTITLFITAAIMQSGSQSLTVRLMPRPGQARLSDSKDFKIDITRTAWQKGGGMTTPVPVAGYALPELSDGKQVQFKGNDQVFSHTLSFEATVPYKLPGWANSQPLRNDVRLKEEVVAAYNRMIDAYRRKDGAAFMGTFDVADMMVFQASYLRPEEAKQKRAEWIAFVNSGDKPIAPLENYELEIGGNGRLVHLRRTDGDNRGEGVIRFPYRQMNRDRVMIYDVYFHKPAGSDRLEAIWYYMTDHS